MKKLLLSVLCLTLLVSATFFASGCKKKHTHSFTEQMVKDEYLSTAADCTNKAKYFYSCSCGEKGSATFEYGEALNHSFTNYVSDSNATCTEDGTKTAKCDRCNQTDTVTDIDSKLGHEFTDYVSDNNATYEKDGTKTAHCNRNGCTATDTIPDEGSELESEIFFKTLSVGDENVDGNITVSGIVPNSQTTFSFVDEIEIVGVIKYVVSLDIYGIRQVATRIVPLSEGENVIYVIELLNGESGTIYEVSIRRRPMYNVIYRTNGGTAVNGQTVEEGAIISAPETTRAGYTFENWSYDFTQPITESMVITANWTANADTAYKTEYYLENLENSNYTLYETVDLQGTTDTAATADIKTYDHFTLNEYRGVLSGNIAGDGSLVLKVFYTRNTYALSNENYSYGEITNETTKKYGSEEIKSVVTAEYLGCEFVGWFNGEKLISTAKEYTFTVEYDVIARFKANDEMSNFTFNASPNTCEITGVKDNTVSEIIVPDYVTSIEASAFRDCSSLESITLPFIGASKKANNGYNQVFGYIFGYIRTTSSSSIISGATFQYEDQSRLIIMDMIMKINITIITFLQV